MRMCGLVSNCLSMSLRYHILYLSPECQYFVHQCKLMTLAQHILIIELLINHIPLSMKLSVETVRDMKLTKTGSYQTLECQKIVQYCFFVILKVELTFQYVYLYALILLKGHNESVSNEWKIVHLSQKTLVSLLSIFCFDFAGL